MMDSGGSSEAGTGKGGAPIWLFAVLVFVAFVAGVLVVLLLARSDDEADDTAAPAAAVQVLVLEAVGTPGPDPFAASVAISEQPLPTDAALASTTTAPGNQPGLYGGTQNETVCDPAALVDFLERDPAKAAAWATALGITPDGIANYVATLTPVLLRTDTRVTNHGFANGIATPRQSVLQAGSAVLVDSFGVPRVRCSCGNPLTEPASVAPLPTALASNTIALAGQPWTDWDPQLVLVVIGTVQVNQFVVTDVVNGTTYTVLIGGAPVTTTTTTIATTTTTTTPPPLPVGPGRCEVPAGTLPSGNVYAGTYVTVHSGAVSCDEAVQAIAAYVNSDEPGEGNTRILTIDGWQCTSFTYGTMQELGQVLSCTNGGSKISLDLP